MKKALVLSALFASSTLFAEHSLSQLLEVADQSDLVAVYSHQEAAAQQNGSAVKRAYIPKLQIGGSATFVDEKGSIDVGETYVGYGKVQAVVFDGFKRENMFDEYNERSRAASAQRQGYQKSLALDVTKAYYNLLDIYGDIDAQTQSEKQLQEELKRQQRFAQARIVTDEQVARIEAALANARYRIEALQFEADTMKANIKTMTGIEVDTLKRNTLTLSLDHDRKELDTIGALRHDANAMRYLAKQSSSVYYPSLIIDDTYSFYDYDDYSDAFPLDRVEKQNRLSILLEMTLFDSFGASKQKEALLSQAMALQSQLAYESKRADANLELAKRGIERSEALLKAAKSALDASLKTFDVIEKKYQAKIVDYVKYLDALYQKRDAQAQYNRAQNAKEVAYANYIYQSGLDIKEYVQ